MIATSGCRSADLGDRLEPVHVGHREVEQHCGRAGLGDALEGGGAVAGLPHHLEVGALLHPEADQLAQLRHVVDQEDRDRPVLPPSVTANPLVCALGAIAPTCRGRLCRRSSPALSSISLSSSPSSSVISSLDLRSVSSTAARLLRRPCLIQRVLRHRQALDDVVVDLQRLPLAHLHVLEQRGPAQDARVAAAQRQVEEGDGRTDDVPVTAGQCQASRRSSAAWSSIPKLGSSMCTECPPWWMPQVRKIRPVARPSRFAVTCPVLIRPEMMM